MMMMLNDTLCMEGEHITRNECRKVAVALCEQIDKNVAFNYADRHATSFPIVVVAVSKKVCPG